MGTPVDTNPEATRGEAAASKAKRLGMPIAWIVAAGILAELAVLIGNAEDFLIAATQRIKLDSSVIVQREDAPYFVLWGDERPSIDTSDGSFHVTFPYPGATEGGVVHAAGIRVGSANGDNHDAFTQDFTLSEDGMISFRLPRGAVPFPPGARFNAAAAVRLRTPFGTPTFYGKKASRFLAP